MQPIAYLKALNTSFICFNGFVRRYSTSSSAIYGYLEMAFMYNFTQIVTCSRALIVLPAACHLEIPKARSGSSARGVLQLLTGEF